MAKNKQIVPLIWPRNGLAVDPAFTAQPEGTTRDCLNVRPIDPVSKQIRGGRRAGISKSLPTQLGSEGGSPIQGLWQYTTTGSASSWPELGYGTVAPNDLPSGATGGVAWHPDEDFVVVWELAGYINTYAWDADDGFGARLQRLANTAGTEQTYFQQYRDFVFSPDGGYFLLRKPEAIYIYPFSKATGMGTPVSLSTGTVGDVDGTHGFVRAAWHPNGDRFFIYYYKSGGDDEPKVVVYPWNGTAIGAQLHSVAITSYGANSGKAVTGQLAIHPEGTGVVVSGMAMADLTDRQTFSWAYSTTTGFSNEQYADATDMPSLYFHPGGYFLFVATDDGAYDHVLVYSYHPTAGVGDVVLARAQLGGAIPIYSMSLSANGAYAATGHSGAGAPHVSAVLWSGAFGHSSENDQIAEEVEIVVGWSPNSKFVVLCFNESPYVRSLSFIPTWSDPESRSDRLIAVAGGSIYQSDADYAAMEVLQYGGNGLSPGRRIRATRVQNAMVFVDGTSENYCYWAGGRTDAVESWSNKITAGELPYGSGSATYGCSIVTTYRERVVMAGLGDDPSLWFMSRIGDPNDWDYAPAVIDVGMAVAGHTSDAGTSAGPITALAPYNDDLLIIGEWEALWVLQGDPAAGGMLDNISRTTGVVGPDAWTFDNYGNFYFLSSRGLYRLPRGSGAVESVSQERVDKLIQAIDHVTHNAVLVYDTVAQGIHIFLTEFNTPANASLHYYWDQRTNSFWKDMFPATVGPVVACRYQLEGAVQSCVLLGGPDGYIRAIDPDADDDDGTAIMSRIRFPVINPGGALGSSCIDEILLIMGSGSGGTTFKLFADHTPEAAHIAADANTAPRLSRALGSGRNINMRHRIAQNSFVPVIEQTASGTGSWVFESGSATVGAVARMRMTKV